MDAVRDKYRDDRVDIPIAVLLGVLMVLGMWFWAIKPWLATVAAPKELAGPPAAMATVPPIPQMDSAPQTVPTVPAARKDDAPAPVFVPPPAPQVAAATPAPAVPAPAPAVVAPVVSAPTTAAEPPPAAAPAPEPARVPPPVVVVSERIAFATGSYQIPAAANERLKEIAAIVHNHPRALVITGHTDNVGDAGSNQVLSQKRADAVMQRLVALGVPAEKLSAKGLGPAQPVADNASAEGRAQNRRIELTEAQ